MSKHTISTEALAQFKFPLAASPYGGIADADGKFVGSVSMKRLNPTGAAKVAAEIVALLNAALLPDGAAAVEPEKQAQAGL